MVGIGASAGGLQAFRAFLSRVPADSGMAYVLVQHLAPEHKSRLSELLASHAHLPVVDAENGVRLAANRVYVIPPDRTLRLEHGRLRLTRPNEPHGQRTPIDTFFMSLAEDQGDNAICIVLSGAGSDGTLGLMAVKEAGGFALAQQSSDGHLATNSMPRSAAATGFVDAVLPVEDMPAKLLEYVQHRRKLDAKGREGLTRAASDNLQRICMLLQHHTGHDFSQYKERSLIRRIQRRMQVLQLDAVGNYIDLLRTDREEADMLFHDLLIGVTHFFRDPEAYETLAKTAIPKVLEAGRNDGQIRVWTPGCATGEEAYSIGMLLQEALDARGLAIKVQIFGTEIDEMALSLARSGVYPSSIEADVTPARLERFFVREGDRYRVIKQIREMCVFSSHSLIKDPPFSNLHLISCRNLLIYFNVEPQKRLIPVFHYALKRGGFLFLGASENLAHYADLFDAVHQKHRIFRSREAGARPPLDFPVGARTGRDHAQLQWPRITQDRVPDATRIAERRVLENYAPAYVIVDRHGQALHFSSARTGRYLAPAAGAPTTNILDMARKGLRHELRAALHRAVSTGQRVECESVVLTTNGDEETIRLVVEPVQKAGDGEARFLVLFQEIVPVRASQLPDAPAGSEEWDVTLHQLEDELRTSKEHLQATIEELETANEELQSSNEEMLSANEELQSSNEELETSKEELESLNEELYTVNAQLNAKLEELAEANNNLKNLVESTRIALIFLDRDLSVRSFTPAVTEIFYLIDGDINRPIGHVVNRLNLEALEQDARTVLTTTDMIEREVSTNDEATTYIMRILPYRTTENVVEGVVISFVDITERKRNEEEVARLAALVGASEDAIIGLDLDGTITSWNRGATRLYGYGAEEIVGTAYTTLVSDDQRDAHKAFLEELRVGTSIPVLDTTRMRKDASRAEVSVQMSPVYDGSGWVAAALSIERDIGERLRTERQNRMLLAELDHRVKNLLAMVQAIAHQTVNDHDSIASFIQAFEGRLAALSRAQDLATRSEAEGVDLRELARAQLVPYGDPEQDRVIMEGDAVRLGSSAAVKLAMVLHELATNAAKYGALSTPEGQVRLRWHVSDDGSRLRLTWTESGGPPVVESSTKGFGLRLIERSLAHELDGSAGIDLRPSGVLCELELPLRPLAHRANEEGPSGDRQGPE